MEKEENKSNVVSGSRDALERNAPLPRKDVVSPKITLMSRFATNVFGEKLVNSKREDTAAKDALFAELVTNASENPESADSRDQLSDVAKN